MPARADTPIPPEWRSLRHSGTRQLPAAATTADLAALAASFSGFILCPPVGHLLLPRSTASSAGHFTLFFETQGRESNLLFSLRHTRSPHNAYVTTNVEEVNPMFETLFGTLFCLIFKVRSESFKNCITCNFWALSLVGRAPHLQ